MLLLSVMMAFSGLVLANSVTIYPSDDAQIYRTNPNTNYGILDTASSGGVNFQPDQYRGFIKYNISSCIGINSSDVIDVTWYAYEYGGYNFGGIPIHYRKLASSGYGWNESTITWNNQPPITASNIFDFVVTQVQGTEHQANITSFAKSEITSGYDSLTWYGFNENGNDGHGNPNPFMTLYTKEAINQLYKPKLVITYNGTLTCNGTSGGSAPITNAVSIPTFPSLNQELKCWANITGSGSILANWVIMRSATNNGTLSFVGGGVTPVTSGVMTNVGNLSSYLVLDGYYYQCQVTGDNGIVGNQINSFTAQVKNRGAMMVTQPSDTNNGTPAVTRTYVNTTDVYGYAYVECNYKSPTSVNYFPPNATGSSSYCYLLNSNSTRNVNVSMVMNEIGTWSLESCAFYLSGVSTCPAWDLSNHKQYNFYGSLTWQSATLPTTTGIYISPTNPKGNDTISCNAKIVGYDGSITGDGYWIINNGNLLASFYDVVVTNNTFGAYATLNLSAFNPFTSISCAMRGTDSSGSGNYVESSPIIVGAFQITNILTTPEPTLMGYNKRLTFNTPDIATRSTAILVFSGTGNYKTIFKQNDDGSVTKNHTISLGTAPQGSDLTEIGTYNYALISCNCYENEMGNEMLCPSSKCAYSSGYPNLNYAMTTYVSDIFNATTYYAQNSTFGNNVRIFADYTKIINVGKMDIHLPSGQVKTFYENIYNNENQFSLWIPSGQGKNLSEIGSYSADIYAGYGSSIGCLETSECTYSYAILGVPFTISADTSGKYIENLTITPFPINFGSEFTTAFDVTNETDVTCMLFYTTGGSSITGLTKTKTISSSATHWEINTTTGNGAFLEYADAEWQFDITTCKINGSQSCLDSDCGNVSPSNCLYCMKSQGFSASVNPSGITNITWKKQIAVGEDQVVSFIISPATKQAEIFIPSRIVGQPSVHHVVNTGLLNSNWTIHVPFTEIESAIKNYETGSYSYEDIGMQIISNTSDGTQSSEGLFFDINSSILFEQGMTQEGTGIGNMIGLGLGIGGVGGDMLLAILISMLLTIGIAMVVPNQPILMVAVFVSGMCGFALIGMLPVWIPIILIFLCGFIVTKSILEGMGGG